MGAIGATVETPRVFANSRCTSLAHTIFADVEGLGPAGKAMCTVVPSILDVEPVVEVPQALITKATSATAIGDRLRTAPRVVDPMRRSPSGVGRTLALRRPHEHHRGFKTCPGPGSVPRARGEFLGNRTDRPQRVQWTSSAGTGPSSVTSHCPLQPQTLGSETKIPLEGESVTSVRRGLVLPGREHRNGVHPGSGNPSDRYMP